MSGPDVALTLSGLIAGLLPLIAGAVVVLGVLRKIGR